MQVLTEARAGSLLDVPGDGYTGLVGVGVRKGCRGRGIAMITPSARGVSGMGATYRRKGGLFKLGDTLGNVNAQECAGCDELSARTRLRIAVRCGSDGDGSS